MKGLLLKNFSLLVIALALSPICFAQAKIAGEWQGTLDANGTPFRIAWHVVAAPDGSFTSTIDNIDQSIYGIKVKSTTVKDSDLILAVDDVIQVNGQEVNVVGTLVGTLNKDATELTATWTQTEPAQPPAPLNMKRQPAQPAAAAQPSIAGDWEGTLSAGGAQLRLVMHFVAAKDGSLTATMDSVDQGSNGIPVSTVTLNDSKLNLTVDVIHGTYEGTVNKDGSGIDGTWSQGQPLPLNFKRATTKPQVAAKPGTPSDIDGTWQGSLELGATKLRIVFRIVNTTGGLTAQMQSPDQSPVWMTASSTTRNDRALTIDLKAIGIRFEGKIAQGLGSIDGTFTQGGNALPLVVRRIKDQAALEIRHPQNPVKPYPYREEQVNYTNKAASNTLAATLTVPPGKGPFPAVLLIAGSGPNDRDESLMGQKPFLVLSDYLTRKGIAVLRADKRGIGKSTGDLATATTADFASDAEAGVEFLRTRPEADPHRIGLIGHSEGGTVAPMVVVSDPRVAFIVLMAGTGVPGDQIIVEQLRLIEEASGVSKEKAAQDAGKQRELLALVEKEPNGVALDRELREQLASRGVPDGQIDMAIKALTSPWYRYTLTYDPAIALRKVACPVLALDGEKDLQVPPAQNLPAIRKALEEGGNKHFEVDELPGLNHLFQTAKTGSPTEYAQIEETMSPLALDKIAGWILKQ